MEIEEFNTSWIDETWASLSTKHSDFVPYVEQNWLHVDPTRYKKNVKLRIVEMLRENLKRNLVAKLPEREKSIRRMVKERSRRQSHREGYNGLIAILPLGTKSDKISITTTATSEIIKTRSVLEELRNKNRELTNKLEEAKGKVVVGAGREVITKLRIRVCDPTSAIDSMTEVLNCLKELGSDVIKMRSQFSDKEFTAEVEIKSQIGEDEVEKAVQKTLVEVEKKLLRKRYSMP